MGPTSSDRMTPDVGSKAASAADVRMQWAVRIPMRDGVHLSATLYIGNGARAAPAIFTLTPYIAQTYHDVGVQFAAQGYPFLSVDVRGRGNSDGAFQANGNEARDCYDIIEWLAQQPYCNGKVAMWGGSYSGYVQWAAAKEFPPHLATIAPAAAPFRGVDSPAPNNIFMPYRVQWLTLLAGRTSQEKIFADQPFWNQQFRRWFESGIAFRQLDTLLGSPSSIFQEWLDHPERDAYWDSFNPTAAQYAEIGLPVLSITGMYDTNQRGALRHHCEHLKHCSPQARARHYLIIGPWDHAGTRTPQSEFAGLSIGSAGLLDLLQLHVQWYRWVMQAGPKPPFLRKNVAYYVMDADIWRYADALDDVTARVLSLYLHSNGNASDLFGSGSLAPQEAAGAPDQYVHDPRDVSLARIESAMNPASRIDQRMVHAAQGRQFAYHSAPFDRDTEVCGFFSLEVWLAIDQPDTDFRAVVYEVAVDGNAIELTADTVRARYRSSLREQRLIETRKPLRYAFEHFAFVARRVRAGRRLRLVVGPIHSIFYQKNYNAGGSVSDETVEDARTVTVTLFHDASHPSALHVPLAHASG
jgi:putative CocE/NonD family hydrolase